MITTIKVKSFKSIVDLSLELGQLNVFVGANGSGKSNLLEAIGVLSAAAEGRVNDQTLLQRGVRPGVPRLYKASFPRLRMPSHINFSGASAAAHYDVSLNNPLRDPRPSWRFKTELFERGNTRIASRSPNSRNNPNTYSGLAALELVRLKANDPALDLMQRLQNFVIYSPTTPVLRGVAKEEQPRSPLGLSGGSLPEAVLSLLQSRSRSEEAKRICADARRIIGWAESFGVRSAASMPLSLAASTAPNVIRFVDRFMRTKANELSGYDASEGALYVLFLAVIAGHRESPLFCSIDNADHGLNPALATELIKQFSSWILEAPGHHQVLMTSHNPAVLDGLPLQDDRVRLFAVDRNNHGHTTVRRVALDRRLLKFATNGWSLSRLWTNKLIGGMPNV